MFLHLSALGWAAAGVSAWALPPTTHYPTHMLQASASFPGPGPASFSLAQKSMAEMDADMQVRRCWKWVARPGARPILQLA